VSTNFNSQTAVDIQIPAWRITVNVPKNLVLACGLAAAIVSAATIAPRAQAFPGKPATASDPQTGTTARSLKALDYRRAGKSVDVYFTATDQASGASGQAKVETKSNRIQINAKFTGLPDSSKFGLEYLTYVLWAISPQGRAVNLGELVNKNGNSSISASVDMQTFGMIVTAEPYYAVAQPGDEVVLENALPEKMLNRVENISTSYNLISRGSYSQSNTPIENAIFGVDRKAPLELFEARNAVRIARNAHADTYDSATFKKATDQLQQAETAYQDRKDKKIVIAAARNAIETAEESRVISVQKKTEEDAALKAQAEREAAAAREAKAQADAAAQAAARAQADADRQAADQARSEAEKAKAQADAAAAAALAQQKQADAAAAAALAQQKQAEAARAAALAQQQQAEAAAAQAQQAAAQAEKERADMRAQLLAQLNAVLQTQDTARGLIVNMSDVLFDTGKYTLKPPTQVKLAKISGILLAHPGLTLQIEGHTDSVGSDEFNQKLSEQRADAVRDFLASQGVAASSMTAKGFGKTDPIASNDTPEGRQKNRRVELVVNGAAIGNAAPGAPTQAQPQ
jgi:outer membrane protein OmpA-like peptidoglycan-associated protein